MSLQVNNDSNVSIDTTIQILKESNPTNQCEITVDPILLQVSEVESSSLTNQFIVNGKESISRKYSTKILTSDQFAMLAKTVSNGIINIKEIVNSTASSTKSNEATKKISSKAEKIIQANMKDKLDKELKNSIQLMKTNENELITGDKPSISSLEGIINLYNTTISNKIIKIIILRSLIRRYTNTGDDYIVPFIFEFLMIMLDIKNEWQIIDVETTIAVGELVVPEKGTKVNHRKARMQAVNKQTVIAFDYPTVKELVDTEFSERIKQAINIYVNEAKTIITTKNIDPIHYQMVETYYRLKPISTWDKKIRKLDEWQKDVVRMIDNFESIIITAPTSSGKTVLAQYCAANNNVKKVLFVVPSSVLANQVAGSFANSGIKTALLTNEEEYNVSADCKVFVSTPCKAEEVVLTMDIKLDYAVFDEIQQINEEEGEGIERLIKTVNCPFLILSATIHDPENFRTYLSSVTDKDVKLVKYNKRFIVQQKHLWNGDEMVTLHPLNCIDYDYIVNDRFTTGDLAMTPRDVYVMGKDMAEVFNQHNTEETLHPNLYFDNNVPITMDMVSVYETHLKNNLIRFASLYPDTTKEYINKYKIESEIWTEEHERNEIPRIIDMFKSLKTKQMLPALVFMQNDIAVLDIFKNVVTHLETMESYYLPWYQNFMQNLFDSVKEFEEGEETLKKSIAKGITGKGNKSKQINDSYNQSKRLFITEFLNKIKNKYETETSKSCENTNYSESEKEMIANFLKKDFASKYNNYHTNQLNSIEIKLPEFNPFCPTSLFSFHKTALSVDVMRRIKSNLKRFISQSVDSSIAKDMSYNNIFIRGLERGIILYSKILPTPFQRIVQELIVGHQAPICICDYSLGQGVNFPTRTSVMLGSKINENVSVLKAMQMSGRSGRRGFDTQGHVVYCRVNYKNIMRGTYVPFTGKDTITPFTLLPGKIFGSNKYILDVVKTPLKVHMDKSSESWNTQELLTDFADLYNACDIYKQDGLMTILLWHYRDVPDVAYNIFVLIDVLLQYNKYLTIDIVKKSKNTTDDHDNSESEQVNNYKIQPIYLNQLIELLFRIFDRDEADEGDELDESDVSNLIISTDPKFVEIIRSSNWPVRPNMKNKDIIDCIIRNQIDSSNNNFGYIANVVNRVHSVILNVLKMYNLFAQIGNKYMTGILRLPLDSLINFNNKLKSLN
jgi:hypothetical protein